MNSDTVSVVDRMQCLIDEWESARDHRVIFLSCYAMMTRNMLIAVENGEFEDNEWVSILLHRFADYYFDALSAYNAQQPHTPAVWKLTFDASRRSRIHVLQHLLLGVNAHINYDLVFVIYDILHYEWSHLSPKEIQLRYRDHCHVNDVIYETIDRVQDEVVERYSEAMDIVDTIFLTVDEWLLYRLISNWREQVWDNAARLMQGTELEASDLRKVVGDRSVLRGQAILLQRGIFGLRHIF